MVSTFHGLELGKRGLSVGQASLSTTGQNIANVNTKGYSRQQVNSSASPSLSVWTAQGANTGQLGTGVTIDSITRVRDRFLDQQFRDHSETLGQWQAKQTTLDRLETIVNEPSDSGLNSAMNSLNSAWQDLANEPDSLSAQAIVKERAQGFVEVAQSMNKSMTNLKSELTQQTQEAVAEANDYLKQITELNKSIVRNGNQSNDLKDKRDALVEDLSKLMAVKVDEKSDGSYSISLSSNKQALVAGEKVSEIDVDSVTTNPKSYGGKLAGLGASMDSAIHYQDKLISVVKNFTQANTMTKTGGADQALFIGDADNFNLSELKVNYAAKPLKQPAATDKPSEDAQSYFRELVSELGAESQAAISSVTNHEATLQATENRRQSVTGVSLDEEMANLVKYQHSYNAAARLVSMTDQMLDTIINRMAN
ncbi:flagellar hook-associated protein FlgK [Planococcus donghaensis]|uniref:Flagellar hook-associated protein 1 n=1 Tax=Planococcus donghaensis TaxID=414778 RepID=A0A1C7ELR7_9BACL|nr:flagellar hook-associated protein FlgK [Planococcus donghaensis]ANU24596.1 flagellar hook-associated protein FlgK [Planococcus donghaensis]